MLRGLIRVATIHLFSNEDFTADSVLAGEKEWLWKVKESKLLTIGKIYLGFGKKISNTTLNYFPRSWTAMNSRRSSPSPNRRKSSSVSSAARANGKISAK